MPRVLVVVVGMPGSGKSFVARALSGGRNPVYVMGDVIRERLREKGLPITLENMMQEAEEVRRLHGPAGVALLMADKLKREKAELVIIDGARGPEELKILSEAADCLKLVAVVASPATRLSRLLSRGREGDPRSMGELLKRDLRELSFGLGNLIALADHTIVNEGGEEELLNQLNTLGRVLASCGNGESVWKYL